MSEQNPYQSPAASEVGSPPLLRRMPWRLYAAWFAVYAVNLVVPLFFGWSMTRDHGRTGVIVAIGLYLLAGSGICIASPRMGMALVVGGVLVALSQVVPVLQMLSGMIGFLVVEELGHVENLHLTSELAGLLVTMVTGGLLLAVAAGIGLILQAVTRWWRADEPGAPP